MLAIFNFYQLFGSVFSGALATGFQSFDQTSRFNIGDGGKKS